MSSGPDLFVVCKECGSEVSPYITECPYCGHRLRKRAPDLPREKDGGSRRSLRRPRLPRLGLPAGSPPYVTIALVAISCVVWVVLRGGYLGAEKLIIIGPLRGDWWKLFTTQFAYLNGLYAFVTLLAVAIFGWLLERRRGPVVALVVFLGAGATGALVASALYAEPIVSGGNAAALGLLAAWAAPDLEAARAGYYYEGDLLGVAAIAALLLALPFARPEASWLAGVTGALLGLVVGFGMYRLDPPEL
ncbi:MAG TPA: rhomboid family intramembrane serine protease [Solirubrobacteraceae bacterium]|nr:rhomboid family intramembrane serine protease [Solirubrobacteraceae bacterium]